MNFKRKRRKSRVTSGPITSRVSLADAATSVSVISIATVVSIDISRVVMIAVVTMSLGLSYDGVVVKVGTGTAVLGAVVAMLLGRRCVLLVCSTLLSALTKKTLKSFLCLLHLLVSPQPYR